MTQECPCPLDPDIERLLEAERRASGMPTDASERLRGQLLPLLDPGGDSGDASGGHDASGGPGAASTGLGAASASGSTAAASGAAAAVLGSSIPALVVAFGLGLATGVGIHALVVPRAEVEREVTVSTSAVPLPAPPTSPNEPEDTMIAEDKGDARAVLPALGEEGERTDDSRGKELRSKFRSGEDTLGPERVLLDRARTALTRRSPRDALAALSEHSRRYPRGRLTEEREALMIQALIAAGRYETARRRAEAFHRRYPTSLFRVSVDAALTSIPAPVNIVPPQTDGEDEP